MGYVDKIVHKELLSAHAGLSDLLKSDVVLYSGPMRFETPHIFREIIQQIKKRKRTLSIILTTGGGLVEPVERAVEIIRYNYHFVNFIVPDYAMSAGTIFCMSGDRIYMDQASSLGPIDPQLQKPDGTFVPALGYLEQFEKLVQKSVENTISPAEIDMLRRLDLGDLNRYDQARNLTVTLLKKWLVKYKFKNWKIHRTTPGLKGAPVTDEQKQKRAEEIARDLGDVSKWHSHARHICLSTLKGDLKLRIEDYTQKKELSSLIKEYNDLAVDYMQKSSYGFFVHTCHGIIIAQ